MTDANAYDPSTWGSEDDVPEGSTSGVGIGANDATLLVAPDRDALRAEWGELRLALEGAERKLDKLLSFVVAGEAETERLRARLAEINELLES